MLRHKKGCERSKPAHSESSPVLGVSTSSEEELDNDLRQGIQNIMKLRDEYDRLEGALKKLGVDPDCSNTEEEDGYNAESDLEEEEEDTDGEKLRHTETFVENVPTIRRKTNNLHRVEEESDPMSLVCAGIPDGAEGCLGLVLGPSDVPAVCQSIAASSGVREALSCPGSPTDDSEGSSSGFSTLRRRSINVTEKVRQNRDGSKIQVVRESAVSTSSASAEPRQSVTFQQNSFVYINGSARLCSGPPAGSSVLTSGSASSSAGAFMGRTAANDLIAGASILSSGTSNSSSSSHTTFQSKSSTELYSSPGYHQHPSHHLPHSHHQTHSSSMVPSSAITDTQTSGNFHGVGSNSSGSSSSASKPRIVRLNSIEPNTVMFSTKDYPLLADVSVPEIIDELERQFDAKLCQVQGVRLTGNKIFICLSQKECLNYMAQYGFYVRGVHVTVMDISNDSLVVCLIGVPHYITDSTITMLVSTFGICIGEVERRFYKGVDTGERYVRLKPKASCQIPDYVTVGGCKILVRVLTQDEVVQPFILDSVTSQGEPSPNSADAGGSKTCSTAGVTRAPQHRSKPGHCNGSLNSPGSAEMPPPPPPLALSTSSAMNMGNSSGILSPPPPPTQLSKTASTAACGDSGGSSLSLPSSPKIGRSFRSRLNVTLKSPPGGQATTEQEAGPNGGNSSTYVPGESVDGGILPPPPPPPPPPVFSSSLGYPENGSVSIGAGGAAVTETATAQEKTSAEASGSATVEDFVSSTGTIKRGNRESPSASSLRKYAIQNNSNSMVATSTSNNNTSSNLQKGDSSISINSGDRRCSLSDSTTMASREGVGGNNTTSTSAKRTSVVFEEPKLNSSRLVGAGQGRLHSSATAKTVNGILRKGSLKEEEGDDEDGGETEGGESGGPPHHAGAGANRSGGRKTRKAGGTESSRHHHHHHRSGTGGGKHSRSHKGDSTQASGEDTGADSSDKRSSRSRSNSTKSNSKSEKKDAGSLALTRDLPWCGCWGNGCL